MIVHQPVREHPRWPDFYREDDRTICGLLGSGMWAQEGSFAISPTDLVTCRSCLYLLSVPPLCRPALNVAPSPTPAATGFQKFDGDKPQMDLIAPAFRLGLAEVLTYGRKKYSRGNYLKGADWSRYLAALERHLCAWAAGEDTDPKTGKSHLLHVAACAMILTESQRLGVGRDDRSEVHGNAPASTSVPVLPGVAAK